jgi:Tfp pilus assembly protein PilN
MTAQTVTRVGTTLPIVNLMPPEFGAARRLRHVKAGVMAGVLVSAALVASLYGIAASDVSSAQEELDGTKAQGIRLQSETAKYSNVPLVIAKVDAAKVQRAQAMAQEIRWSIYLNDLSLRIPSKIWLTSLTVAQTAPGAAATAAGAAPVTGIGQVTFEGNAYSHNDVATWLEMLGGQTGWTQPYLTTSTVDDALATSTVQEPVTFSSSVTITDDALSRRFEPKAGS